MHLIKNPNFKVSVISLDLDDTLWPVAPVIAAAEAIFYQQITEHYPRISDALDERQLRDLRIAYMQARPSLQHDLSSLRINFIDELLQRHGYAADEQQLLMKQFMQDRNKVEFYPGTLESLNELSQKYTLVACTNGNADVFKTEAGQYFQASISSEDVGVAKPDKRIFDALCQQQNCRAPEVLHIGDNPQTDTLGALHAGMHSVWFNRDQLEWPHPQRPHASITRLQDLQKLLS